MKKIMGISFFILLCCLFGVIFIQRESITKYIVVNYVYKKSEQKIEANQYKKNLSIGYVQETDNFYPNNRQDLLNIFYTALNNGVSEFTYYCLEGYQDCLKDSDELIQEEETLSNINNLVHPYNSYQNLSFSINTFGRVDVKVHKQYTNTMIKELNQKVDDIVQNQIQENMSIDDKIKTIHDYIINNSVYDKEMADNKENSEFQSDNAYGVLLEGHGICSGFSDAMELFLTKFNVTSYKISSPSHIWNLVYHNNTWNHLDLTWDNPVVNTGEKMLLHDYFLISTDHLKELDSDHHNFNEKIYQEA